MVTSTRQMQIRHPCLSYCTPFEQGSSERYPRNRHHVPRSVEAPKTWFDGLNDVVDRILITYGEFEGFAPGIQLLCEKYLKPYHEDVMTLQQRDGVHGDPILKFIRKQEDLGDMVPLIVDWVAELFMN